MMMAHNDNCVCVRVCVWMGRWEEVTDCCRVAIAISRMFKLFANVFKFLGPKNPNNRTEPA